MSSTLSTGANGALNLKEALPVTVKELTAEWFSKIFKHQVKEVKVVGEIHGTGSKILIELVYEDEASSKSSPHHVCVKGGFNPVILAIHPQLMGVYRLEASFFYYMAPSLKMRLPPAHWSTTDTVTGQGIVVMEDLKAAGFSFGDPLKPFTVSQVRSGVEQLAVLHARTWSARQEDHPWLLEGLSLRHVISSMMRKEAWAGRFDGDARPPVPDYLVDRERIIRAYHTLWNVTDPRFRCVLHGDSHIGNTFITPEGDPGFLDWQGLHTGSAIHDVAYFIVGSLTIQDRRQHEAELFEHYLGALHAAGGPKFTREETWDEYRKHNLHGFAWALTPPIMQSKARVDIMSERHCAAIVDHKSLELLESLPEYGQEWKGE